MSTTNGTQIQIIQGPGRGEKEEKHVQFHSIIHFYWFDIWHMKGFINDKIFCVLFHHVSLKTSSMKYWDGKKKKLPRSSFSMSKLEALRSSPDVNWSLLIYIASKPCSFQKLSLKN